MYSLHPHPPRPPGPKPQRAKLKRVSLNETPEFPFWGLNICVDFDLRDSEK